MLRQNKFALLIVPYGYCQTTQNMFYEKISCLCFYCVYKTRDPRIVQSFKRKCKVAPVYLKIAVHASGPGLP